MAWSEKARKAAALARKRNSKTKKLTRATPLMKRPKSVPPSINLAQSSRTKHKKGETTSKSGRAVYKPKKGETTSKSGRAVYKPKKKSRKK